MIADEILNIKGNSGYNLYSCSVGFFFRYDKSRNYSDEFRTCREEFSSYFRKENEYIGFYYYYSEHKVENGRMVRDGNGNYAQVVKAKLNINLLNKFFEVLENKLNLEKKTEFFKIQDENGVVIKLSPFWTENDMKRGFLTLFLRGGALYYKKEHGDDLEPALGEYNLSRYILHAIRYFLAGNTKAKKQLNYAIYTHFVNVKPDDMKDFLEKPDK